MDQSLSKRIAGLDILRTTAILLVVFRHSHDLVSPVRFPLPDGVDLFFVLSGYLIGTILFKTIQEQDGLSLHTFFLFLKRRWFRTFPNYFLFLSIHLFLAYKGLINEMPDTKSVLRYVAFLQNFNYPRMIFYWESWSLSIEEWFYLLFPCVLLLFFYMKVFTTKNNIFLTILLFLILPLIYRIYTSIPVNSLHWDVYYRKLVLTRLDTIGFGLLGAYVHLYYPGFWKRIAQTSFITGGLLFLLLSSFSFQSHDLFHKTIYFSLSAFSILLLLPKLSSMQQGSSKIKLAEFISRISYSAYLVHMPLLLLFSGHTSLSPFLLILNYLGYLVSVFFISWIIYAFFEKLVMDLAADHTSFRTTVKN